MEIGKTVHISLSVRGALRWPKRMRKGLFRENGQPVSADRASEILMDYLAAGWEVLPMAKEACEGFDPKDGCPGHAARPAEAPTP